MISGCLWNIRCGVAFASFLAATCSTAADGKPPVTWPDARVEKLVRVPPTAPVEAAKTFRVRDGFSMDLLAAEPLVASPVSMTYDEDGRAYVCEMRDYPYTDKASHKAGQENPTDQPIGRVRLLEDLDGDGVFDHATVFAEGLSWPTGVACWKGGVFIAATPDLWYCKDTDGDGKADLRQKVLAGFRKLNVQAVMNSLVWGLDNHIHGAGGSNGGRIQPGDQPDAKPLVFSRNDFRLEPVTMQFELLTGGARFGGSFDDWGNRFLCNIRNPAQHIVLPSRYLERNPFLAGRTAVSDMAESGDQLPVFPISKPEPWRVLRATRWAGERDIVMPRSELVGSGVVTSASGVTSYRGAAYPASYAGNVFVAESAGNLFYRLQLTPEGVTFKAARVDGKVEMVASTDNWFRPVNFCNAPDGTLHVLDMYRENIEHPWSIPEDIHAVVDLEAGRDMGRIWRLTPPGFQPGKPPRLSRATTAELVAALEHPNGWWRETAQRLLFERQDKTVTPALHRMVRESRISVSRLHALWTLQGLGELEEGDLLSSMRDEAAGVREHAVRLAERSLSAPRVVDSVLQLATDKDVRVRFQVAFTLGGVSDSRAMAALASVARQDAADPWVRAAVLSSVGLRSDGLLLALLKDGSDHTPVAGMIRELAQIIGARHDPAELRRVISKISSGPAGEEVVLGLAEGLKRSGKSLRVAGLEGEARNVVEAFLEEAARNSLDEHHAIAVRCSAIHRLAFDEYNRVGEILGRLLDPGQPQEVQIAAVSTVGSFAVTDAATLLLANWPRQTPSVRGEVVLAMLGAASRMLPLMEAIERGTIAPNQIPFDKRRLLLRSLSPEVKKLAEKHFGEAAGGTRAQAVEKYLPALELSGNAAKGKELFGVACLVCHRAGNLGASSVGPNLASIRAWNPDQILINILDPNREVVPTFVGYAVETNDGRSFFGLIAEESAASLTLRRADGGSETLLRSDIAKITGSGLSLMPDGFETIISMQGMADLIEFLRSAPPAAAGSQ